MLQLILGRAGSGKTTELYRRIGQVAEAGGQAILLVPEQFSFETNGNSISVWDRSSPPGWRCWASDACVTMCSGIMAVWRDGRWTIQPGASSWG